MTQSVPPPTGTHTHTHCPRPHCPTRTLPVTTAPQESKDDTPHAAVLGNVAWRARQNAAIGLSKLDDIFRQAFSEALNGAAQMRDLEPPTHVDRVHKLLQRSNAAINMAFTPF